MALTSGSVSAVLSFVTKGRDTPSGNASTSTVASPLYTQAFNALTSLTYGTGSGQFNTLVVQDRTLAGAATESLNLFDGSVLDVFGKAAAFQNVKLIAIYQIANPTGVDASSITIGNAAATILQLNFGAGTSTWTIYKGGSEFKAGRPAGYTVDTNNKLLKILNNDATNSGTYKLIVAGVHV